MRQLLIFFRLVIAVFALAAFQVHAQNSDPGAAQRESMDWLRRIQTAAHNLSYAGTFVYQQGSQVRTSRITHVADKKGEFEKLEILDGKPREYIRRNDEVTHYVPESKTLFIEKRITPEVFPAIFGANPIDLAEHYHVKKGEIGRVAGFECQAIILEPKDRLRYGYRLWSEKSSGLLLRAQTYAHQNEIVEQIAFTQVVIGNIDRSNVRSSFPDTTGWRIEHSITSPATVSGWTVSALPRGFKKIRELKRLVSEGAESASVGSSPASSREVTQLVFSDGLAAISVFIEPGTQSRTEGSMQQGAMNIIGKRQGDFWLTIVGEVPAAAIRQVANSIEFKSK